MSKTGERHVVTGWGGWFPELMSEQWGGRREGVPVSEMFGKQTQLSGWIWGHKEFGGWREGIGDSQGFFFFVLIVVCVFFGNLLFSSSI